MRWTPSSWTKCAAAQMPDYANPAALETALSCLDAAPPLVRIAYARRLSERVVEAAAGRAFIVQGGDCAETFADFGADSVRGTYVLLQRMAERIAAAGNEVIPIARIAGQFAKPRSNATETQGNATLPSYRGDIVNDAAFDAGSRASDPMRMLDAYRQSERALDLLRSYAEAAPFDRALTRSARALFTSHEALLLPYEQALTRRDPETGAWWATSAHMLWIGERSRQRDGAHVEYARGIANTIGLKCGPGMQEDDLLRLIERLDPDARPGRLILIGRFGAQEAEACFTRLMRATRSSGSAALWVSDPMHGNTQALGGHKTRRLADILAEAGAFFDVAAAEGVHAGGLHLELTGEDVTECVGGMIADADVPKRYLSACDPRLNPDQAMEAAALAASRISAARASRHAA